MSKLIAKRLHPALYSTVQKHRAIVSRKSFVKVSAFSKQGVIMFENYIID